MRWAGFSSVLLYVTAALAAHPRLGGEGIRLPRATNGSTGLQDIVTWDEYSLKIHGERVFIFSGEIHPYRMPVQSLWLDVFQKVKAMGFNAVSFYTFWGIHEPKKGEVSFEGFRDLKPFFDAAMKAGLYLIARPGPNAETTGGGFPGWSVWDPAIWRTSNATYHEAWQAYMSAVGKQIADQQITKGGPVILVQTENEYTGWQSPLSEDFVYEKQLLDAFRSYGVDVPIIHNDASPTGHYRSVDIWGYDGYPNGFDCSRPYTWRANAVPENYWDAHLRYGPEDPNAIFEFQGGAFDGWGGSGYDTCATLLGPEFERVFYKNKYAMSTTILNLYMIWGGTNWGGIAHPGVYTSYDYGSAIREDRTLREKYYELKLHANFLKQTPAYLTSRPQNVGRTAGAFTGNTALKTTQTLDVVGGKTGFYTVRLADASSNAVVPYNITLPTSAGNLTLPLLGGSLELRGKDSKIHVVDYDAGKTSLIYSTGEIATWASISGRDVILLYGNTGETHETAIKINGTSTQATVVGGTGTIKQQVSNGNALVLQYTTTGQTVVSSGDGVLLYILDRANAYDFWSLSPPSTGAYAAFNTKDPVLVKGGYLIRSLSTSGGTLALVGDLNATASFEIIAPASSAKKVTFNGENLSLSQSKYGTLLAKKNARLPAVTVPDLKSITWKTANSLPEISSSYSDATWRVADHTKTNNTNAWSTPTFLSAGDYGFNTGNIIWRAHFTATGQETAINSTIWGGAAFGYSVWLGDQFVGSWVGNAPSGNYTGALNLPTLTKGKEYILTILQDHMGLEEDWVVGTEQFKWPRGITHFNFVGSPDTDISVWKLTGNLGGEDYVDRTRGPLNEGGLYGERQGWHLPGFDDSKWKAGRPADGISAPGVQFYRTSFNLNVPTGVDYPLALVVSNSTTNTHYRAQFYVNGWQFGKYVNSIGPQRSFPVPQGVLDYRGSNSLAVSLWAQDEGGAKIEGFGWEVRAKVESSLPTVVNLPAPKWTARPGAY